MIRILLAALIALATIAPAFARHNPMRYVRVSPAFPTAKNNTITLDYMPGGIVGEHMRHAKVWLDRKYRVVIRDDQYSAAAVMVVAMKINGAHVCAKRGADLYFHLVDDGSHPGKYLNAASAKVIGAVTYRYKRIAPAAFGIKDC